MRSTRLTWAAVRKPPSRARAAPLAPGLALALAVAAEVVLAVEPPAWLGAAGVGRARLRCWMPAAE